MTRPAQVPPANYRDPLGRFTKGCLPGPGRPCKPSPHAHIPAGQLYLEVMDLEDATRAWQGIVNRIGPSAAAGLLKDLEASFGRIRFRHAALAAIAQPQSKPPRRLRN